MCADDAYFRADDDVDDDLVLLLLFLFANDAFL